SLLGNVLDGENKGEQAIAYYDSSLKLNAYSYYTWFNKGLAFYNDNKIDEAQSCFQKAFLINPYHSSSHYYFGLISVLKGTMRQTKVFGCNIMCLYMLIYINKAHLTCL